jgi:acetyl-CoA decarbonylase/synthase, CODH/ACS complex subunit gamma
MKIAVSKKVKTRQVIIPGYVAQRSDELEENLPGWTVVIGP